jgi:hypothetical protein
MIDSLADDRIAMDGLPIGEVACGPRDVSPQELAAMYVALAEECGAPREELAGTTIHSDYIVSLVGARMFTRFPVAAHRRVFRITSGTCWSTCRSERRRPGRTSSRPRDAGPGGGVHHRYWCELPRGGG